MLDGLSNFTLRVHCDCDAVPLLRAPVAQLVGTDITSGEQVVDAEVNANETREGHAAFVLRRSGGVDSSWLPPGTSAYRPGSVRFRLVLSLGTALVNTTVVIVVAPLPLPGVVKVVDVATRSTQWLSASSTASSSGSSVGRIQSARALLICDGSGRSEGGLLSLQLGSDTQSTEVKFSQGAIVGNLVLVAAVACLFVLAAACHHWLVMTASLTTSLLRFALPSSLLIPWTSTLSTTVLGVMELVSYPDRTPLGVALAVIGSLTAVLPLLCLGWVSWYTSNFFMEVEVAAPPPAVRPVSMWSAFLTKWLTKRYEWRATHGDTGEGRIPRRALHTILLEYRRPWYAAFDWCVLLACSIIGGVFATSNPMVCRASTATLVAVYTIQLAVCVYFTPFMTRLANVVSISALACTTCSVLFQLVFAALANGSREPPLWPVYVASMFNMVSLGCNALRFVCADAAQLLRFVRRLYFEVLPFFKRLKTVGLERSVAEAPLVEPDASLPCDESQENHDDVFADRLSCTSLVPSDDDDVLMDDLTLLYMAMESDSMATL